jgi:SAM-dependent methyltransferase
MQAAEHCHDAEHGHRHDHEHRHEHYDHYDPATIRRLDGFWGLVDARINARMAEYVSTKGAIDVGSGFGSLTAHLQDRGIDAVGVDMLGEFVTAARERFPKAKFVHQRSESLPPECFGRETAVLKDALHHLVSETDFSAVCAELSKAGVRRVVVSDPNPNFVVRTCRRLIGHVDPECDPDMARRVLEEQGFRVTHVSYDILFSLPLSGGYVGPVLFPSWKWLGRTALAVETGLVAVVGALGLKRTLCWRYFLVGERPVASA